MGDRYFDPRHPNIELLLRRPPQFPPADFRLPGIGHNGAALSPRPGRRRRARLPCAGSHGPSVWA